MIERLETEELGYHVVLSWFTVLLYATMLFSLLSRRRQQELEQLHEELEYQLRCLIDKPGDVQHFVINLIMFASDC